MQYNAVLKWKHLFDWGAIFKYLLKLYIKQEDNTKQDQT